MSAPGISTAEPLAPPCILAINSGSSSRRFAFFKLGESLPQALLQLRRHDLGQQTTRATVARNGRCHQTLHLWHRHLAVGEQQPGRRNKDRTNAK
jgi:hypothetical protein